MQAHVVAHHGGQHLQPGHDTVAGGGFVQQDHMAGVFRTDAPAQLLQLLQHVAVAHFGASERNAQLFQRQFEPILLIRVPTAPPRSWP